MKKWDKAFRLSYTEELVYEYAGNRPDDYFPNSELVKKIKIPKRIDYKFELPVGRYERYLEFNDWID